MAHYYWNLFAYFSVLFVSLTANILPINGQTTVEIVNQLPVLFTPANFVFSISGLIFVLVGLWVMAQLYPSRRSSTLYKITSNVFVLSCIFHSLWIFAWHYNYFLLSVFFMISLLLSLWVLYNRVNVWKLSSLDLVPFSIYLSWISIATLVNLRYYLVYIDLKGFGLSPVSWTISLLFISAIAAVYFFQNRKDALYPLVFTWVFIGIGVKNLNSEPFLSYLAFGLSISLVFSLFLPINRQK